MGPRPHRKQPADSSTSECKRSEGDQKNDQKAETTGQVLLSKSMYASRYVAGNAETDDILGRIQFVLDKIVSLSEEIHRCVSVPVSLREILCLAREEKRMSCTVVFSPAELFENFNAGDIFMDNDNVIQVVLRYYEVAAMAYENPQVQNEGSRYDNQE